MPGYGPENELSIQVLGPASAEHDAASQLPRIMPGRMRRLTRRSTLASNPARLRWLEYTSKTKNGQSIVLRVQYRDVSLLLGGDLNISAENLLLAHHTGLEAPPENADDKQYLVAAARDVFQVDIAKCCHHGSADFSPVFLQALNPIATIISSGDNEPYSHPRSDTLGTIGLHSRGPRPLIFSTELARSAPEAIKHPHLLRREFEARVQALSEAPAGTEEEQAARERLRRQVEEMGENLNRSVAVYGAINVVTDGRKVVIAQKLERPRSRSKKWQIYRLEAEGRGPLRYQSRH